jgi:hypothetical protein
MPKSNELDPNLSHLWNPLDGAALEQFFDQVANENFDPLPPSHRDKRAGDAMLDQFANTSEQAAGQASQSDNRLVADEDRAERSTVLDSKNEAAYRFALEVFQKNVTATVFWEEVLGPKGIIHRTYTNARAMAQFAQSPEYREIQKMFATFPDQTPPLRGWDLDVERGPDLLFVHPRRIGPDQTDWSHLVEHVWSLLEKHCSHRLVLELQDIGPLDNALIDQLIWLQRRIESHQGVMRLCGLTYAHMTLLCKHAADSKLTCYLDRKEAIMGSTPVTISSPV